MSYTELAGHWLLGRRFSVHVVDVAGHRFETTARVIGAWIRDDPKTLPVLVRYRRRDKRPIVLHLEIEGACPDGCHWIVRPRSTTTPRRRRSYPARMLPRAA